MKKSTDQVFVSKTSKFVNPEEETQKLFFVIFIYFSKPNNSYYIFLINKRN